MAHQQADNAQMTVESCVAACASQGYGVAGMEYGVQCFCDDFLRNAATTAPESDCGMNCGGNANEKCGAGNRLSVYSNSTSPVTVYPVPSVQKTGLSGSWNYSGCIHDDAPGGVRALPYQMILKTNNTANNCITQCSNFGFNAGGMEYGEECYVRSRPFNPLKELRLTLFSVVI